MRLTFLLLLCHSAVWAQQVTTKVGFPSSEWVEPFPVTINVSKGDLTGFGKVQLSISPNAEVSVINRQGATFTSSKGEAKFLWMDMPKGDLELTFLVTPEPGEAKEATISGAFYFMDKEGNPQQRGIELRTFKHKGGAPAIAEASKKTERPTKAESRETETAAVTTPKIVSQPVGTGKTNPVTPAPKRKESEPAPQPVAKAEPEPVRPAPQPRAVAPAPAQAARPAASSGLVFRAQVSAQKTYNPPAFVGNRMGLTGEVHYDSHEDWHKYTTGDFTNYRAAKVYANELRETNQVPGSFVVGFENGQRITIQRAIELAK